MHHHASCVIHVLFQARQSLEKAKAALEEERQSLTSELKSLQANRMESERGRKRADGQLQEVSARLSQAEREREEREERIHKLQVGQKSSALVLRLSSIIAVNFYLTYVILVLLKNRSMCILFAVDKFIFLFCFDIFSVRLSLSPAI